MKKNLVERANRFLGEEDDEQGPDRWKKNFIVLGPQGTIVVQVIAAENNGWRSESGVSKTGKVIERNDQMFKSTWHQTFWDAEDNAIKMARKLGIRWKPQPYGDREKFNVGESQITEAAEPLDKDFADTITRFLMGDRDVALRKLTAMKDTLPSIEIESDVDYNKSFNDIYSAFYDVLRKIRSEHGSAEV